MRQRGGVVTKKLAEEVAVVYGRGIRMAMAYRDITSKELARLMGYRSAQTVSPWVNGRRSPEAATFEWLAQCVMIPAEQILRMGAVEYDRGERL